jgi:HK97 family phage major capsid protein
MVDNTIKRLYEEAAALHKQAQDILGKGELDKEQTTQVDNLLDEVENKVAQARRLEKASAQETLLNTPVNLLPFAAGLAQAEEPAEVQLKTAFGAFARKDAKGMSEAEFKTLFVGEATAGGYLVQDTYLNAILTTQRTKTVMRQICRVLPPVPSGSVITPTASDTLLDATWTTEVLTGAADTAKPFGEKKLTPHPLAKEIGVSNTLLRNPNFDVEAFVRDQMAYKFNVPEEQAFINGTGVGPPSPLGILQTVGLPTFTTVTALSVYGNDVINWVYSLPSGYAGRAKILCNRAFVRKLRASSTMSAGVAATNYLWMPGLEPGQPDTILGVPYVTSDKIDDGVDATTDAWEANAVIAVIGDWDYYWIVDALNLTIQRLVELAARTNTTIFIGRKECDGMCVQPEAFYALKVHA